MANKKIVVLKFRELIYTGIFLFFGIILVLLLITMFRRDPSEKKEETSPTMAPVTVETNALLPGLYTTDLTLGGSAFTMELRVQSDLSTNLRLVPSSALSENMTDVDYISTMYPLVEPSLTTLQRNLAEGAPLSEITFSLENQYTGSLLRDALEQLLARINPLKE